MSYKLIRLMAFVVGFSIAAAHAQNLPDNIQALLAGKSAKATEPVVPVAKVVPSVAPQEFANAAMASDVFGAQLFTGSFAHEGATQFNPDYLVSTGDTLQVRLWGSFVFDAALIVDPQGNIFLPHVGPIAVRGVRNLDVQTVVDRLSGASSRPM